ncbi:MAG: hypothetical protein ABSH32_01290 [Bryobacteraceae bacterium]|jgi:hypothetical protein
MKALRLADPAQQPVLRRDGHSSTEAIDGKPKVEHSLNRHLEAIADQ